MKKRAFVNVDPPRYHSVLHFLIRRSGKHHAPMTRICPDGDHLIMEVPEHDLLALAKNDLKQNKEFTFYIEHPQQGMLLVREDASSRGLKGTLLRIQSRLRE